MKKNFDSNWHFGRIAHNYRNVRVTDTEPIDYIVSRLSGKLSEISILDVGCGTGRYTEQLIERLQSRITLLCVDLSREMLNRCQEALQLNIEMIDRAFSVATASLLPCKGSIADLVLAFNAIHHFDIRTFLAEASRVLKIGGILAIYTRTPEQNRQTIWGRYFPNFAKKESRLHSLDKWEKMISASPLLSLEEIRFFNFRRHISSQKLRELALTHHYSTFSFYARQEFYEALKVFEQRIERKFANFAKIPHVSPNVLLLLKRV